MLERKAFSAIRQKHFQAALLMGQWSMLLDRLMVAQLKAAARGAGPATNARTLPKRLLHLP